MRLKLQNIQRIKRGSKVYLYHRKTRERLDVTKRGTKRTPEQIAKRVLEINGQLTPRVNERTVRALVISYRKSRDFLKLSPGTRRNYQRELDIIMGGWGQFDVERVEGKHLRIERQKRVYSACRANNFVSVARNLMRHAYELGWRDDNPARDLYFMKHEGVGWLSWPDDDIEKILAYPNQIVHLAVLLGLHTGQRIGDILRAEWRDIEDGCLHVRQQKTGTHIRIFISQELGAGLNAVPENARFGTILKNTYGRTLTRGAFDRHWHKARRATGTLHRTFHAFRTTFAKKCVDAGVHEEDVQIALGHKSRQMTQYYARERDINLAAKRVFEIMNRAATERCKKDSGVV